MSFPNPEPEIKRDLRATGGLVPARRFPAGAATAPGEVMLAYIPVRFDLYRSISQHLHWTLQSLVAFADKSGRCFPSIRTLVRATGRARSTLSRHLAQLAAAGIITRQRRPGGAYTYVIDKRFLPAMREVSHQREEGVPRAGREEQPGRKQSDSIDDEVAKWRPRLRSWQRSRFWLPFWGPKPSEAGCWAPPELLGTG